MAREPLRHLAGVGTIATRYGQTPARGVGEALDRPARDLAAEAEATQCFEVGGRPDPAGGTTILPPGDD